MGMTITLRNHRHTAFASDANPESINRDVLPERRCSGWRNGEVCRVVLSRYNSDLICASCSNERALQITLDAQKHSPKLLRCSACCEYLPDEEFSPKPSRPVRRGRDYACRECSNLRRREARMAGAR